MKNLVALLCLAALAAPSCKTPTAPEQGPPAPEPAPLASGEAEPETDPQQAPLNEPPPKEWSPPQPSDDGWVWIKMKNGEWFKGELSVVRKDSVEFESDEVGDLNLDFDDIAVFRSSKLTTVRLNDERIIVGTLLVQDDQVVMQTPDGEEVTFPRSELYTIVPGQPGDRKNRWSGTLSLGFTGRAGNTEQVDTNAYFMTKRRTTKSRFTFSYTATYSEVSSVVAADNQRLETDYRYYLNRRAYLTPITVSLFRDPFQNIDLQATPGVGGGYTLVEGAKLEWDVDAGVGLLYTRYETVQPTEDEAVSAAAALFGTSLHDDLTAKLELDLIYNLQVPLDERLPNHHAELRASVDVWADLDLDVSFIWDHQGSPVPDANGNTPLSDDYRLVFGVGWDF